MKTLTYNPDADTLALSNTQPIVAGYDIPLTVLLSRSATVSNLRVAIVTANGQALAYIGAFTPVNSTTYTATLNGNASQLVDYLVDRSPASLFFQLAGTFDGERVSPDLVPITVKRDALNSPPDLGNGQVFVTTDDLIAALAAYAPRNVAGKYRIKAGTSQVQLWNSDQNKFHTLGISGAAGAEVITIGAGED